MKWIKLFENFQQLENIVIIGGGIASLYAGYLLKKKYPKVNFTILEQSSECGGRVKMSNIGDVELPTGAQFSRLNKDKTLSKLLKELKVDIEPYKIKMSYTFDDIDVDSMIEKLQKNKDKFDRKKMNFSDFGKKVLGKDYSDFIKVMGYTDFENSDFIDTLENYGLDDNIPGYQAADIPWTKVIDKLIKYIGSENIKLNSKVNSIEKKSGGFLINSEIKCDGLIIGVTVKEIRKLLDDAIYDEIESQEFIKIFAKSKDLKSKVKNYTVVDSELKKIIPIKDDIFAVAFSDNNSAKKLKGKTEKYVEDLLSVHFDDDIRISNMKDFYWKEGTHYYKPLSKKWKNRKEFIDSAQHPMKNVWVIGEMVAEKQGWVDGALLSVENISLFKK